MNKMQRIKGKIQEVQIQQTVKEGFLMLLGMLSAGMGLKGFLLPQGFLDGGAMGIALLTNKLSGFDLSFVVVLVNVPFILLGYKQVSTRFAFKTVIAVVGLAVILILVPYPPVTSDKLLIAVFGGFFLGAGIGFTIRGGAVLDGTEVLALYISRRSFLSVGDVIMMINILIFSCAAFLVDIETALYAMLTYLSASKTVDFIIQGFEEYMAVMIISDESEQVRKLIVEDLGRGVTVLKGRGGYGKRGAKTDDIDIIYTVITRLEVPKLKNAIQQIDENAFIIQHSINDTRGGMIKKRPLH